MEEEYIFTSQYKVGDILFYTDINESLIRKLRIRTVRDSWMVGVVAKMDTIFIGRDKRTWLFRSMLDAKKHLEDLGMVAEIEVTSRRKESGDDNE